MLQSSESASGMSRRIPIGVLVRPTRVRDELQNLAGSHWNVGARAVYSGHAAQQLVVILGGITPPQTTMMSPAPAAARPAITCGTRVLWPAAWEETPTT